MSKQLINSSAALIERLRQVPAFGSLSFVSIGPDVEAGEVMAAVRGNYILTDCEVSVRTRSGELETHFVPQLSLKELGFAKDVGLKRAARCLHVASDIAARGAIGMGRESGILSPFIGDLQSQETRSGREAMFRKRAEAFETLFPSDYFSTKGQLARWDCFGALLEKLPPNYRKAIDDALRCIEAPTELQLEENARVVRRMNLIEKYPAISEQFSAQYYAAYDIGQRAPYWSAEWEVTPLGDISAEHSNRFFGLDKLLESIPLPEETLHRRGLRQRLHEENALGFGTTRIVHHNHVGFVGSKLFPQRALDTMALRGAVGMGYSKNFISAFELPEKNWNTVDELLTLQATHPEIFDRIKDSLRIASINTTFSVASGSNNKDHREILGLDNTISWHMARAGKENAVSHYGDKKISLPMNRVPGLVVSLDDDVEVRLEEPNTLPRYAIGLLSVSGFQDYLLDIYDETAGQFKPVRFPGAGPQSPLWEVHTHGAIQLA